LNAEKSEGIPPHYLPEERQKQKSSIHDREWLGLIKDETFKNFFEDSQDSHRMIVSVARATIGVLFPAKQQRLFLSLHER
jgi:hypothetical protein